MCNLRRMAERRRVHQLQILLVLRRRAARNFIHPFRHVWSLEPAKAVKRGKKLVVLAPPPVATKLRIENESISLS